MLYRVLGSLLVVLVCVGGYLAFDRTSQPVQDGSDASQTQTAAPAAAPSSDDNSLKDLKVN